MAGVRSLLGLELSEKQKWKRSSVTGGLISDAQGRHPSWFEAVFDLIIVASFSALGEGLQRNLDDPDSKWIRLSAPLVYMLQFTPIYTSWSVLDTYINRFGVEGILGGLTILVNTIIIAIMNFTLLKLNTADSEKERLLAFASYCCCNLASNLASSVMYLRVCLQTDYKRFSASIIVMHLGFALLWLVLAQLGEYPTQMYVVWTVVVLLEHHRIPMSIKIGQALSSYFSEAESKGVPIDVPLFIERNGLLLIIAIGECLMATVEGGKVMKLDSQALQSLSIAVSHAFLLKVSFFDVFDSPGEEAETHALKRSISSALQFIPYMLYAVAGVTLSSQMLKDAEEYKRNFEETGEAVPLSAAFMFAVAMGSMLLSFFHMSICHVREEEEDEVLSTRTRSWLLVLAGVIMTLLSVLIQWTNPYHLEITMQGIFAAAVMGEFLCRYLKKTGGDDKMESDYQSISTTT